MNPLHVHDYDMTFPDKGSMSYELRCRCGDVAHSMGEAVARTHRSMLRRQLLVSAATVVTSVAMLVWVVVLKLT